MFKKFLSAPVVWLSVAGLAFLDVAAFSFAFPIGFAAVGLSCFALEWRLSE